MRKKFVLLMGKMMFKVQKLLTFLAKYLLNFDELD